MEAAIGSNQWFLCDENPPPTNRRVIFLVDGELKLGHLTESGFWRVKGTKIPSHWHAMPYIPSEIFSDSKRICVEQEIKKLATSG